MTLWYTITVHGQPVEGSTDDREEAIEWLKQANGEDEVVRDRWGMRIPAGGPRYDGLAKITVTKQPIAW